MMERNPDFLGFFLISSGISLSVCKEFLLLPCEFRLAGGTFSEFLLPIFACSSSLSDFLKRGRFMDSEKARGCFTAMTSSLTELTAISFCRAAKTSVSNKLSWPNLTQTDQSDSITNTLNSQLAKPFRV